MTDESYRDVTVTAINASEQSARKHTSQALANFAVGSVLTGLAAYFGSKGHDVDLGVDTFLAATNYSFAICGLSRAIREGQRSAALRGAVAQYDLAAAERF